MQSKLLMVGLVVVVALGTARRAEACGGGLALDGDVVAAAVLVAGTYVGVTAGMAIKDIASDNHSRGYGVAETVIHAPLATLFAAGYVGLAADGNAGAGTGLAVMALIHGGLAAHGIYTIAKRRPSRAQPAPTQPYDGPPGM